MSRGPGRIQRAILDLIATPEAAASFDHERHPHDGSPGPTGVPLDAVFVNVYGTSWPTRPQRVAVHRAVRILTARGLIDTYSRRSCPEHHRVADYNWDAQTDSWGCCGRVHSTTTAVGRPRTNDENNASRQIYARAMAMVRAAL